MSSAETNNRTRNRRISALAVSSLGSSIIAVMLAFVYFSWLESESSEVQSDMMRYVWWAMWLNVAWSYISGLGALIQNFSERYGLRLWWLAWFGMVISSGVPAYYVILVVHLFAPW